MSYEGKTVLNYTLTRKLGEGGFGAVYLGEHADLGRKAAIKILHHQFSTQPQMVERFFQEARAVCAINHRAIIAIENFGRLDTNEPFYLMEFFPGGSLTQVASERWLTSDQLVGILDPIAEALTAAHAKGIIHRDLKPDNVMVRIADDKVADVRLLDFGIAKLLDGQSHSMTGNSMGTPAYMPPEQALDAKNVDVRADVYSFGATVYAAVAGRPPFHGSSVAAILLMVQTDTAELIQHLRPDVPPALDAAIRRCLAKQRDHRPPTIAEAWQAIRTEIVRAQLSSQPMPPSPEHVGVQTPLPIVAATNPPPRVASEPATSPEIRERSKLPLLLGGVGVVAVLAVVVVVASTSKPDETKRDPGMALASPPDAATSIALPPDVAKATPLDAAPGIPRFVVEDVFEPFRKAVAIERTGCGGKPGTGNVRVLYRVGVSPDGALGRVAIEGVTTPIAECVRKALEHQHIGLAVSRTGGEFAMEVDMPADPKKLGLDPKPPGPGSGSNPKPPGPGSNPKPPDPKPDPGCGSLMVGALKASGDAEVRAMLARLETCRGKIDAAQFTRIQQTLIGK